MSLLQTLLDCICPHDDSLAASRKAPMYPTPQVVASITEHNRTHKVVAALSTAEKAGGELQTAVKQIVGTTTWTETLARCVLDRLTEILRDGAPLCSAMREAFDKAVHEAGDFAQEHPVYITLIALGILVIMLPWVIEALGFTELGPITGSFAAWWQSTYAGYVPESSLFSFFQRLGMTWK